MRLSQHARVRMQQRGISRRIVDWLAAYGETDHQRGAVLFYFTGRVRQALEREFGRGELLRHEKALDAYMVCSEGVIVTVGHLHRRVVRH